MLRADAHTSSTTGVGQVFTMAMHYPALDDGGSGHLRVYQYLDVPPEEFDALMAADSKGRFVNRVIKPAHSHRAA